MKSISVGSAPLVDTDGDGIADGWENLYGLDPNSPSDALLDSNSNGWTNVAEYNLGGIPTSKIKAAALDSNWPSGPSDVVGATKGSASVSAGGSALYSIPIPVTPGTNGMQPMLSLSYSNQSGDGLLGNNWQLNGLASITRGSATHAVDGYTAGVNFDGTDRYYLNGKRLIAVSQSAYGALGTEYRTEVDSYAKIVSYESAGIGPKWFKVWTKDGQILEFGNSPDSRLVRKSGDEVLTWGLNRISDRFDNAITVDYHQAPVEADYVEIRPKTVRYTCTVGNPTGYASVTFNYGERPDPAISYICGTQVRNRFRMTSVVSKYQEQTYRILDFVYDSAAAGYPSRLKKITESTTAGGSYRPTDLIYQERGAAGYTVASEQAMPSQIGTSVLAGDIDGDGLTDLLHLYRNSSSTVKVEFWKNEGGRFYMPANSSAIVDAGTSFTPGFYTLADMDADGAKELVHAGTPFFTLKWYPSGWNLPTGPAVQGLTVASNVLDTMFAMDMNSDGRDDLVVVLGRNAGAHQSVIRTVFLSTSSGYQRLTNVDNLTSNRPPATKNEWHAGDIDGDGVPELIYTSSVEGSDFALTYKWNGSGFVEKSGPVLGPFGSERSVLAVDVNSDNLTDLVIFHKTATDTSAAIFLADGKYGYQLAKTQIMGGWISEEKRIPVDYNGDSKTDIAVLWKRPDGKASLDVWISDGTGFVGEALGAQSFQWQANSTLQNAFLNLDARNDVIYLQSKQGGASPSQIDVKRLIAQGGNPNLLTKVVDGMSATVEFSYLSTVDPEIYKKGPALSYPLSELRVPFNLVSRIAYDNGLGGTNETLYTYSGLRRHVHRGLQGFAWVEAIDAAGIATKTTNWQDFPYTGMQSNVTVADANSGVVLSDTENAAPAPAGEDILTLQYGSELTPRRVYRPQVVRSITKRSDLNGTPISTTSESLAYDQYGNTEEHLKHAFEGHVTNLAPVQGSVLVAHEVKTEMVYDYDASSWLIDRLKKATTTARTPTAPALKTRNTESEYWPGKRVIKKKTTQPGTALALVEDFTYDIYGNLQEATTSAADVPARTSKREYNATLTSPIAGRFVGKEYSTAAATESISYEYDSRLGLITKKKDDVNGTHSSYEYDSFGAITKEERSDGSVKTYARRWNEGVKVEYPSGASSAGAYHIDVRQSDAAPALTIVNRIGQTIREQAVNAEGSMLQRDIGYSSRGNRIYESRPYSSEQTARLWATTSHDALNRAVFSKVPFEESEPDGENNTIVTFATTSVAYDGRVTTETNPLGVQARRTNNVVGWLTQVFINPHPAEGPDDAQDRSKMTFEHNAFGEVTKATNDSNQSIVTEYDDLGRKTTLSDPNAGLSSYLYYADGKPKALTDANGKTTTYTYDVRGRLTTRRIGVHSVDGQGQKVFDPQGVPVLTASGLREIVTDYTVAPAKGVGQPEKVIVKQGGAEVFRHAWQYDIHGRLWKDTRTQAGRAPLMYEYLYDSVSRPWIKRYPGTTFGTVEVYNALGYTSEVRIEDGSAPSSGGQILWAAQEANLDNKITAAVLGNGSTIDWTYDPVNGRQTGIVSIVALPGVVMPSPMASDWTYSPYFDSIGNLKSRSIKFPTGVLDGNLVFTTNYERFEYDKLNRLKRVEYSNSINGSYTTTKSHTYDRIGNIASKTGLGNYTYDPLRPQAVSGANGSSYTYDFAGNMKTGAGGLAVTWTSFNQPETIAKGGHSSAFTYGANDERVSQVTDRGNTYYAGSYERYEPAGGGAAEERYYVMTPVGRSAVVKVTSGVREISYMYADHLGSVEKVADAKASLTYHYNYDAWGLARSNSWSDVSVPPARAKTTRGFTDHEMLDDLGLVHMNGRVYDPVLGRFLSADPVVQAPDNPQSYNRYAYVFNNPLSLTDPTGYSAIEAVNRIQARINGFPTVTVPGLNGEPLPGSLFSNPNILTTASVFDAAPATANRLSLTGGARGGLGEWLYYNLGDEDGRTPAQQVADGQAAMKRAADVMAAYGTGPYYAVGIVNELTGGNRLMAGVFAVDLDGSTLTTGERWMSGSLGLVQMGGTVAAIGGLRGVGGAPRPLADNEIIMLGGNSKPGNFILREGIDTRPIGRVFAHGKSASIATDLTLKGEYRQIYGAERANNVVRGDALSGTFVGDIRAAGFDVVRAPTKSNPLHVRIISAERTFDSTGREWLSTAFDRIETAKRK
ncbi:MAG: RHS repeat-associated core domain-containing protein [Verrucomicrobiota bacterium]